MRHLITLSTTVLLTGLSVAQESSEPDIPPAYAPFEHLVGAWKGQAIPQANRLRGWGERHLWAWKFSKGKPSALTVTLEGDKTLKQAELSHDPARKVYRLRGTDPGGKPVEFLGTIDSKGQTLILDRQGTPASEGLERLTFRLNSNKIRYSLLLETKAKGAPQFARVIDMNLGKEGESFAAGGSAENLPKCVLTGGAATMSVSYQGKAYPVCCTGCRDEFLADPDKYVKKAEQRLAQGKKQEPGKRPRPRGDDTFDGLIDTPKKK